NLPEPKNADNDNLEYSDSVKIDFTKLNITNNSKDEFNQVLSNIVLINKLFLNESIVIRDCIQGDVSLHIKNVIL
ncbi:hypothetical protein RhiirA4_491016, partial [Rhizophagus irregularis]